MAGSILVAVEIAVKKYVVKLSDEERDRLNSLIQKGKHPARQLLKARILLKADASEAGDGWSDSQIADGAGHQPRYGCPHPSAAGGGGFDAALTRKHSPASARKRIFDGAAEAKLIASPVPRRPKGARGGR